MKRQWIIRKQYAPTFDHVTGRRIGVTNHKNWYLYLNGKRVGCFTKWDRALEHVAKVYEKWPDFGSG